MKNIVALSLKKLSEKYLLIIITIFLIIFLYIYLTQKQQYEFVKDYSTKITVGGVVGRKNLTYQIGDVVSGSEAINGIKIRIRPHSKRNDGPPSNSSYQDFIVVPKEYLKHKIK